MGKTRIHIKRYFLKQDTNDWFCLDRFRELNTPKKSFKKKFRRSHKAKAKQAIKNGEYINIPAFKKCHKHQWVMEW